MSTDNTTRRTVSTKLNAHRKILTGGLAAAIGISLIIPLAGCASRPQAEKSVSIEEPRVVNGVLLDEEDPDGLKKISEALDVMELDTVTAAADTLPPASAETAELTIAEAVASAQPADGANGPPAQVTPAEAVKASSIPAPPPEATALVALPRLSTTEWIEISDSLVLHLESQFGYAAAPALLGDALPAPPAQVVGARTLSRLVDGGTAVLRFGHRRFISQPSQMWVFGAVVSPDNKLLPNPDLAAVEPQVTKLLASLNEMRTNLTIHDIEKKLVQLSYVDANGALDLLKGLGVTTLAKAGEVPSKIDFAQLPIVARVDDPDPKYTGLVGTDSAAGGKGSLLSMEPGAASPLSDNAIASPMTQLLVLFHPAHPDQYSRVRHLLDTLIDRPARQIFIEAMVLEISEEGLTELGVQWDFDQDPLTIGAGGGWPPGTAADTLDVLISDTSQLHEIFDGEYDWDVWQARIRALIRTGKAEILSRPSVLTLNNRQSTIRVGRDIPIASSLEGMSSYSNKVAFNFRYLPTGILLNIRPRITESGQEVSMLIDTIVSARVPQADLEMRAPDGTLLASAPTVSTRRVQTYGRIPNNTPLIIGGLVARELMETEEKIPLLGDVPVLGALFRSQSTDEMKREVIIVLTPHVLPEAREARRSYPKDEDHFDSFGNELFRDSYRIRSEDVFDLTFLLENQRIASYRDMARQAAEKNFRLAEIEPFRSFVRDEVPGESILVTRMIYEVIKRLDTAAKIDRDRIIYFESQPVGGYDVQWLEELVADSDTGELKDFGDKALAITYDYDRDSLEAGRLGTEPIPHIRLIDCPNREVWKAKLWEMNQPAPEGRKRHTILIQTEDDIVRLQRALALKRIAVLNGDIDEMRLTNFSVGKKLLMPELKVGQVHVIDADTARFFFHTELYYAATLVEVEKRLKELDELLRRPDINVLLDSGPLAGNPRADGGGKDR